jgi:hypothetical protein
MATKTITGSGSSTSVGYGAVFDKSQWDRLYRSLTGGQPGGMLDAYATNTILDPAVERTAEQAREWIRDDTPVDTGTLRESIHARKSAPADWYVETQIHYAPIVESRPPGGPAHGHGAMFAQNLARIETKLAEELSLEIARRI